MLSIGRQLFSIILMLNPEMMLRKGKKSMHCCRALWLLMNHFYNIIQNKILPLSYSMIDHMTCKQIDSFKVVLLDKT